MLIESLAFSNSSSELRLSSQARGDLLRRRQAAIVSIVAHAALAAAGTMVVFQRFEPAEILRAEIVWLDIREPAAAMDLAPEQANGELRSSPLEAAPSIIDAESPQRLDEPPPPAEPSAAPRPVAPPRDAPTVRHTDWEEERRRAIAEVLRQRSRGDQFLTRADDLEAAPPPVEQRPGRSIFDTAGSGGGRAFMRPQGARTRFGRNVVQLCNALTGGGFGFFGMSFCAPQRLGASGLFPELMPRYLKLRPECVEGPREVAASEQTTFPTNRCRLVPKDEHANDDSAIDR